MDLVILARASKKRSTTPKLIIQAKGKGGFRKWRRLIWCNGWFHSLRTVHGYKCWEDCLRGSTKSIVRDVQVSTPAMNSIVWWQSIAHENLDQCITTSSKIFSLGFPGLKDVLWLHLNLSCNLPHGHLYTSHNVMCRSAGRSNKGSLCWLLILLIWRFSDFNWMQAYKAAWMTEEISIGLMICALMM